MFILLIVYKIHDSCSNIDRKVITQSIIKIIWLFLGLAFYKFYINMITPTTCIICEFIAHFSSSKIIQLNYILTKEKLSRFHPRFEMQRDCEINLEVVREMKTVGNQYINIRSAISPTRCSAIPPTKCSAISPTRCSVISPTCKLKQKIQNI